MDIKKAQALIEKLLRLADNNPNELEAASAAEKAAELALKFGIELSQVNKDDDDPQYGKYTVHVTSSYEQWVAALCAGVSSLNACRYYYEENCWDGDQIVKGVSYVFVGRPHAREVSKKTIEYLIEAINRLNREAVKGKGMTKGQRAKFRKAFRIGAASVIRNRLLEREEELRSQDDAAKEATGSTALVVADYYETERESIREWLEGEGMTFTPRKSRGLTLNQDAFAQGKEAGENVSLDPQIN